MKSFLRTLVLPVVLSLTLACAAISNPQSLLGGKATPTFPAEATVAAPKLATQLAGTLEPETEATPEGGEGEPSALGTSIAATLEAALGGTPVIPSAGTEVAPSQGGADAGISVADSLGKLLGDSSGSAALPSFHLEVKQLSPVMSGTAVAQSEDDISADVQGPNIHYTHTTTEPGGKPLVSEGYIIGEKYYTVEGGKITADLGMVAVTWASWPLNAELLLGFGALKTTPAGTEQIEGRTAEVFTLGGSAADDTTGILSALGLPVTDLAGKLQIDKETGALLKAVVDYKEQASGTGATSKDIGAGHFELTVSRIGKVTVTDPGK